MNIYEKLQECRCELQKMKLKKSGKNKFAGFDYFELKDFLPTINEMFNKHKLFSNFSITENGAILQIVDMEDTNTYITFTSPTATLSLKGCNEIQALGGVHTYLKRYLYLNALEIVENDLFDSTSGKVETKKSDIEEHIQNIEIVPDRATLEDYYKKLDKETRTNPKVVATFKKVASKFEVA